MKENSIISTEDATVLNFHNGILSESYHGIPSFLMIQLQLA